jgi:hypothetical protein
MRYKQAKLMCHVRSAIYRRSKKVRYWKNRQTPLDKQVSWWDKLCWDWEEYDPREADNSSLFMFND